MKRIGTKLLEVVMFTLLVAASVASLGQMSARAEIPPIDAGCAGLTCWDQSDCGSGPTPPCFCNRPSSTCYSNSEQEVQ